MIPKRRLIKKKYPDPNESIIGRKTKKRIMLLESDTDNSIIIEHNRHKKQQCMKDTPIKIADIKNGVIIDSDSVDDSDQAAKASSDEKDTKEGDNDEGVNNTESTIEYEVDKSELNRMSNIQPHNSSAEDSKVYDHEAAEAASEDDGPDEDQMVMSRATRMSIMGVIPKDDSNDTDDSDFIQSDDVSTYTFLAFAKYLLFLPTAKYFLFFLISLLSIYYKFIFYTYCQMCILEFERESSGVVKIKIALLVYELGILTSKPESVGWVQTLAKF